MGIPNMNLEPITITLEEGERQLVLMALAHLAIERPGWDFALMEVAKKLDNDRLDIYREFKLLKRD